jgi:hypothetical protein
MNVLKKLTSLNFRGKAGVACTDLLYLIKSELQTKGTSKAHLGWSHNDLTSERKPMAGLPKTPKTIYLPQSIFRAREGFPFLGEEAISFIRKTVRL